MLFSMAIVLYLFLGGSAAGLLLVTSVRGVVLWSRMGALGPDPAGSVLMVHEFRHYLGRCYVVALVLTLASCACLAFDLGSPARAFLLFVRPTLTPITVGAFALALALVVLAALSAVHFLWRRPDASLATACRVLEVLAVPCAIVLMSYTGLFLALVDSVPLWNTPWTVVLFVLSAVSAGCALSSLVQGLSNSGLRSSSYVVGHRGFHVFVIVLELIALIAFGIHTWMRPEVAAARSLALLTSQPLMGWLTGGVLLLGLAFPLVAEAVLSRGPSGRFCLPADLACLIGCFLLRYCLVAAGLH